ncbi:MAG: hypothetical protein ACRCZI_11405 [Cetobacterium sp.]
MQKRTAKAFRTDRSQPYWADVTPDCELHELDDKGTHFALVFYEDGKDNPTAVTTSFQLEPGFRLRKLLIDGTHRWRFVVEMETQVAVKRHGGKE